MTTGPAATPRGRSRVDPVLAGVGGVLILSWLLSAPLILIGSLDTWARSASNSGTSATLVLGYFTAVGAPLIARFIGRRVDSKFLAAVGTAELATSIVVLIGLLASSIDA